MKIGIATSIPKNFWEEAELYPTQRNQALVLPTEQKSLLALFIKQKREVKEPLATSLERGVVVSS